MSVIGVQTVCLQGIRCSYTYRKRWIVEVKLTITWMTTYNYNKPKINHVFCHTRCEMYILMEIIFANDFFFGEKQI